MRPNRSIPSATVIPVLVYPDVRDAVDWLSAAFGFSERLRTGDNHRSQLRAGAGAVIVADVSDARRPPRPGEVTHAVTVRVEGLDAHCERARSHGARIVMEPTSFEYGERQYTAEDPAGHRWTFSETLDDVAPEAWGGTRPVPAPIDLPLADGRIVRVHDTGGSGAAETNTLLWHHGSPQTGALLEPLVIAAEARGIRLVSYGRPGYGGSSPQPGRTVGDAANDVAQIADALGIGRFAVMGASGGGPHALACAALLGDRVIAAVTLAGLAPLTDEFEWYAGMAAPDGLRSATHGRDARARFAETEEFDESSFTAADWAALAGAWSSLGADAGRAGAASPGALIDDDVAYVTPWGFEPDQIGTPVLLVHGGADRVVPRSHSEWLLRRIPSAELWLRPRDGHVSVLAAVPVAMDWLRTLVGRP